jgi:hypothetical protein
MQTKAHVSTRPLERTSLGLSTHTTFELQLLEVAVRGKKDFESYMNKMSPSYGIDEQVMSLEILHEIKFFEKGVNRNLIVERARDQVVQMKDDESLHKRALVVYRDFMNLSLDRQRESTETLSSPVQSSGSTEFTSSIEHVSREYSTSSQANNIDEKLNEMLSIALPEIVEEESSGHIEYCSRAQGEASGSSCDILSIFDGTSFEEMSIFEKPKETDEGVVTTGERFYEKLLLAEVSKGTDSIPSQGSRDSPRFKVYSKKSQGAIDEECFSWDVSDVKIDLCNEQAQKVPPDFPGKELKFPIQWTIDGIPYEARNIAELRSKHDIAIEGIFKKVFKCHTWRSYYGFLFNIGVMVYFKKHVFKKVADFRESTVTIPKGKQLRLNIHDVHVASRVTDWQLKFDSAKHLKTWCETIVKFSKGLKTEIDGIQPSLSSPRNLISKLI